MDVVFWLRSMALCPLMLFFLFVQGQSITGNNNEFLFGNVTFRLAFSSLIIYLDLNLNSFTNLLFFFLILGESWQSLSKLTDFRLLRGKSFNYMNFWSCMKNALFDKRNSFYRGRSAQKSSDCVLKRPLFAVKRFRNVQLNNRTKDINSFHIKEIPIHCLSRSFLTASIHTLKTHICWHYKAHHCFYVVYIYLQNKSSWRGILSTLDAIPSRLY